MSSLNRNLRILATFAALSLLALAAGCRGFFVNPTLTSITVAPTSASIVEGRPATDQCDRQLQRRQHQGSDGKRYLDDVRVDGCDCQQGRSGNRGCNHIANPPGTATITATSGTITATSTITVNTGPLTAIAISTTTPNPAAGQTVVFTALGTYSGSAQQQDITNLVTWSSSNTAVIATISSGSGAVSSTATSGSTTNVTASLNGINSNTLTITVQ